MFTYSMTQLLFRLFHLTAVQYVGVGFLLVAIYILVLDKLGWKTSFYYDKKEEVDKVEEDIYWRKINENMES